MMAEDYADADGLGGAVVNPSGAVALGDEAVLDLLSDAEEDDLLANTPENRRKERKKKRKRRRKKEQLVCHY